MATTTEEVEKANSDRISNHVLIQSERHLKFQSRCNAITAICAVLCTTTMFFVLYKFQVALDELNQKFGKPSQAEFDAQAEKWKKEAQALQERHSKEVEDFNKQMQQALRKATP